MTDKKVCPLYEDGCVHGEKDENNCDKKDFPNYLGCGHYKDYLGEHPLK